MMSDKTILAAFLAATVAVAAGSAWAASDASSSGQSEVQKDFGKLSADGARAYQDLTLTRLAIYDGKIDQAKKYVGDADAAFMKTKTDDSVFMKAESELKTSPKMQPNAKTPAEKSPDAAADKAKDGGSDKSASASSDAAAKPVAWLPVDGAISIDEDYRLSPAKTKAVAEANKSIAKGDRKDAMDKLKLADVNTSVVLEVLPLEQTISDVHQAAQMIDGGKYYEGSQMLRKVQMAARYDVSDYYATPKATSGNGAAPAATAPSTPAHKS